MEPLVDIPLDAISPSPSNPRRRMEPPVLDQLAASIRAQGILSPIIVRPMPDGAPTEYELVAGERRWRAARLAGLTAIRAQVRELDDRAVLEVQIAENRDRADVHPLDEADAYRRLRDQHHVEVEEIAARAGHPLGYIRQRLSLSQLGAEGRDALLADRISLGIAQKIARIPAGRDPEEIATRALASIKTYRLDAQVHGAEIERLREVIVELHEENKKLHARVKRSTRGTTKPAPRVAETPVEQLWRRINELAAGGGR